MDALPYRTSATDLSDDELVLFDAFWDGGTDVDLLHGDFFHEQWNLGYKHSLSEEGVRETIRSLFGRGLIRLWKKPRRERKRMCVELTRLGGEMWSAERCPVWSRWAEESHPTTRRGKHALQLRALSHDALQNLIEVGTEACLWELGNARTRFRRIANYRLVAWAPARELHIMYAIGVVEDSDLDCDWELFERKRLFWRGVQELQKILETHGPCA